MLDVFASSFESDASVSICRARLNDLHGLANHGYNHGCVWAVNDL